MGRIRKELVTLVLALALLMLLLPLCSLGTGSSSAGDRSSLEVRTSPLFDRSLANTLEELGERELWSPINGLRRNRALGGTTPGKTQAGKKTNNAIAAVFAFLIALGILVAYYFWRKRKKY